MMRLSYPQPVTAPSSSGRAAGVRGKYGIEKSGNLRSDLSIKIYKAAKWGLWIRVIAVCGFCAAASFIKEGGFDVGE